MVLFETIMSVIEPSGRLAIPPEHTIVTINGCEYFRFNFGRAQLIECCNCGVRNSYIQGCYDFYHLRTCEHWRDISTYRIDRYIRPVMQQIRMIQSEIPPPYQEINSDVPPPYQENNSDVAPPPYTP